jgi:hypothetical protein
MPIPSRSPLPLCAALLAACAGSPRAPDPAGGPATDPETVLYLIGDAGAPDPRGDPVLAALEDDVAELPEGVGRTVLFLGDNLYPRGMPPSGAAERAEAERRLRAQLRVGSATSSPTIFIPGNHDWDFSGRDGWSAVRRQEEFVEGAGAGWVEFLPDGGCPGPAIRDLGDRLRLVLIDTEWWLRDRDKPTDPTSSCPYDSPGEILDALREAMSGAGDREVVVVGHHPLATGGSHGGYFRLRHHIFPLRDWKSWAWIPLPVLGSIYPIARQRGFSDQDLSGDLNRSMRAALDSTLAVRPPLAYVSGHVHGLEVLDGGESARLLVISGAGYFGHWDALRWTEATRFAASGQSGYVKLEVERGGRVRVAVVTVDADARRAEAYATFVGDGP